LRPKEVAGVIPAFLSTELKVINNAEMSEYILAAIFLWPVLGRVELKENICKFPSCEEIVLVGLLSY
jgi:hypothetical protein